MFWGCREIAKSCRYMHYVCILPYMYLFKEDGQNIFLQNLFFKKSNSKTAPVQYHVLYLKYMRYKQQHSHTSKEHTYLCIAYKIHPVALFPFPVSFCKLSQALLFSQRTLPDNHAPHKPFEVHIQSKSKRAK